MTLQLRLFLIIGSIAFFIYILQVIKKSRMSLNIASIWVVWGLGIILLAFFPQIINQVSSLLGIYDYLNGLFFVFISILYILSFYLFVKVSILEDKLKSLIQQIALKEKENKKEN